MKNNLKYAGLTALWFLGLYLFNCLVNGLVMGWGNITWGKNLLMTLLVIIIVFIGQLIRNRMAEDYNYWSEVLVNFFILAMFMSISNLTLDKDYMMVTADPLLWLIIAVVMERIAVLSNRKRRES